MIGNTLIVTVSNHCNGWCREIRNLVTAIQKYITLQANSFVYELDFALE